jgi:hypothetical protein
MKVWKVNNLSFIKSLETKLPLKFAAIIPIDIKLFDIEIKILISSLNKQEGQWRIINNYPIANY